jgi:hypothetical protein
MSCSTAGKTRFRPAAIALEENDAEEDPEEDVRVLDTPQV